MCGPCATRHREPCQAGNRAALSGLPCVPQQACTSMFRIFLLCDISGDFKMKNFKAKFMGFIDKICGAVVFGTFISALIFEIFSVLCSFYDKIFLDILFLYFTFQISAIFVCIIIKSSSKSIHKIDADLIGNRFIGLNKKSRTFRKSVEYLFEAKFQQALAGFKFIEENYHLNSTEKGLLFYYIARCYDIMNFNPNAVRYYEMAQQEGFSHDIMTVFYARCLGAMGDIEQAITIYNEIYGCNLTDDSSEKQVPQNKYYDIARTDIAKIYLDNQQPEKALDWYLDAVEKHENYPTALGGCSLAYLILEDFEKSEKYYKYAVLSGIEDLDGFKAYYKELKDAISVNKG